MELTPNDDKWYSVGFNNQDDFFDLVLAYGKLVRNIFFSIPGHQLESGRPVFRYADLFRERRYLERLQDVATQADTSLELVFNSSYDLQGARVKAAIIADTIAATFEIAPRLRSVTVSDRLVAEILRENHEDLLSSTGIKLESSIADSVVVKLVVA